MIKPDSTILANGKSHSLTKKEFCFISELMVAGAEVNLKYLDLT